MKEVCIVGGGPAGLAVAIAVSQSGCRATVVDHALPPIDKACGEGLMPDSIAVLERLGVTVPPDVGFRFRGIRFSDARSVVAADFPNGAGIGIRRLALHRLLLARAEELGVTCLWDAKNVQHTGQKVMVDGRTIRSDFLVAADGQNSLTRRVRGLHGIVREHRRYAFRRHYRIAPWSPYMELHWGPQCQIYVTPIDHDEICVVSMARSPKLRLSDALVHFPALQEQLKGAGPTSREMGALSISRKLRRVCLNDLALVGDASGSVDAITGEGLCLSFKQALSLAQALASGNLNDYRSEHAALRRRPQAMAALMLTLDKSPTFQRKALAALALCPKVFASLLAVHVGTGSFSDLFSQQLLRLCLAFLEA
jgi:flavin-dependent dehydrogenase